MVYGLLCHLNFLQIMRHNNIGSVFDDLQELYTQKMIGWVPFYLESVEHIIPDLAPYRDDFDILDLGTGNGNIAAMILQKYPTAQLRLIDASEKMLNACKQRFTDFPNISYLQAMMEEVSLPSDEFDLVTASYSLHHLEDLKKRDVIQHIQKWLKPGGHLSYLDLFIDREDESYPRLLEYWENFVTEGVGKEEWEELFDHHQKYDYPSSLSNNTRWLQEAGFSNISFVIKAKYWVHILATV